MDVTVHEFVCREGKVKAGGGGGQSDPSKYKDINQLVNETKKWNNL